MLENNTSNQVSAGGQTLIYGPMLRYDIEECAQLAAQSFADYEYFTIFFPDRERRLEFMRRAILSEYRTSFGRAHFLVARHEGVIVAVAQIFPPDYKKPSSWRYLTHGWLRVIALPDQKTINAWQQMDTAAGAYCHAMMGGSTWYLSSLTVSNAQRGKGIGSQMLKEAIIPHVRREGGSRLCLFTNSESNVRFYQRAGFHVVDERQFTHNDQTIGSWSFVRKV